MGDCHCTSCQLDDVLSGQKVIIALLTTQGDKIMALNDDLQAVLVQVGKGTGEVLSKIADLESQLVVLQGLVTENADAKAQLDAAQQTVSDLKTAAQHLDDVVPDEEPPAEPPSV
jgi:hypothetical protein